MRERERLLWSVDSEKRSLMVVLNGTFRTESMMQMDYALH